MIFTALPTVKSTQTITLHHLILAHIDRPDVDGVAGEVAVAAEFDAVREDIIVVTAVVEKVGVAAHCGWDGRSSRFVSWRE